MNKDKIDFEIEMAQSWIDLINKQIEELEELLNKAKLYKKENENLKEIIERWNENGR